jgi:lipopolysaccharide export system permease protein
MTNAELNRHINRQKARGMGNTQMFEDEYYKRFANPLAALILMLIGVSLSSKKIKGGMGLNLGLGLLLSIAYIFFESMSSTFAVNGTLSPTLAVWIPNIVFSFIAIALYMKARKQS